MPLDVALLNRLSILLDEALDLPEAERAAWLARQPEELREELARMLADQARVADGALATLPRLAAPGSGARAGEKLGPYRLVEEIGQGGMGSVWLAERADGAYERRVALKLPRRAWNDELAARLEREQRISARLEHAHIARLYDAGRDDKGRPFIAMEYVAGLPIDVHARNLTLRDRLALMLQVLGAVAYAHAQGVIHRDLKPSNVLIAADGTPRLLDFGIAELLGDEAGDSSHTPRHAAPEQIAGGRADARSDVYSLGVLLYQLVTGELPLPGQPPRLPAALLPQPDRAELEAILARALQPDPAARYGSAAEFGADLQAHLDGRPTMALPDSGWRSLRRLLHRHRPWAWGGGIALLALTLGVGVAWRQASLAGDAAHREEAARRLVSDVVRASASGQGDGAQGLFQHSTELLEQRFADQPRQRAELYAAIGAVLSRMGAFRLASDIGAREITALAQSEAPPQALGEAQRVLARSLLDARDPAAAEKAARAALEASPDMQARILLARALMRRLAVPEARSAVQDLEARQPEGMDAAWTESLKAQLAWLANQRDESTRLHASAVTRAQQHAASAPLDVVTIEFAATEAAMQSPDRALADRYLGQALATLHELGGEHRIREALMASVFAAARFTAFFQISGDEALKTIQDSRVRLHELVQRGLPVATEIEAQVDLWEATALARMNRNAEAQKLLARSLPALDAWARTPTERLRLGHTLGEVNEGLGRYAEADRGYQMALQARIDGGMARHPMTAFQYSTAAENLAKAGRVDAALALLDKAPHFDAVKGDGTVDPERYNHLMDVSRARILLDAGDAAAALKVVPEAWFHPGTDRISQYDAQTALAVRGEARCALQQWRAGADDLTRSLALARTTRADSGPDDPAVARLLAASGLCQWGLGEKRAATDLARRARGMADARPEVGDYYRAPLLKLEAALKR
ncbi:protein kinase domain-containing protein [Roseateles sp. NT4]|uniref:protein kinase domain-containing protein n=1 Tax=Roseateles sp. NT4 TaxID=3453715 RepID=UPI003EEB9781